LVLVSQVLGFGFSHVHGSSPTWSGIILFSRLWKHVDPVPFIRHEPFMTSRAGNVCSSCRFPACSWCHGHAAVVGSGDQVISEFG